MFSFTIVNGSATGGGIQGTTWHLYSDMIGLNSLSLLVLVAGLSLYTLYGIFWRLFLSPIAKFPGPKLAGVTFWYEFYYDVVKGGKYTWEIERMHAKYGPIVRINPYELHVRTNDLDFMNRLYPASGKDVDKFWWSAGMFGTTEMAFGTVEHDVHRLRRNAYGKFFSPTYIRKLESTIQGIVNNLCRRFDAEIRAGRTVNLLHAFSALTQDVITEYCFADQRGTIDMEDFAPVYYDNMAIQCSLTPVIKQFPWLLPMLNTLPDWWMRLTNPMVTALRMQDRIYREQIAKIMHGGESDNSSHVTIFHELRDDKVLPPSEKTPARFIAEAGSLVGAGTLTTAHMLTMTSYYVFNDKTILRQLHSELVQAIPTAFGTAPLSTLDKLPYLTAVINEGLRLSFGSMQRLTRLHTKNTLHFNGWDIPPGVGVGMTPCFLHLDPEIFPNPHIFDPQRWLDRDGNSDDTLTRYLFNFGKGSRQCVGRPLAYAEMYSTLAHFFRRYADKLDLYDTDFHRDVEFYRDYFIGIPRDGSKGVRVAAIEGV